LITEQQHVETSVKATFAEISVVLSFHDEDQKHLCKPEVDQVNVHYLGAECSGIVLLLQVIYGLRDILSPFCVLLLCSTLVVWHDIPYTHSKSLIRCAGMSSRNEV
jgi:hypothetical protein